MTGRQFVLLIRIKSVLYFIFFFRMLCYLCFFLARKKILFLFHVWLKYFTFKNILKHSLYLPNIYKSKKMILNSINGLKIREHWFFKISFTPMFIFLFLKLHFLCTERELSHENRLKSLQKEQEMTRGDIQIFNKFLNI